MKRLLVIDTSYLIYRSYFAYPNLTFHGKNTGAFFGFAKSVLRLLQDKKPTDLVFALDTPEKTWRHEEFEGYKGKRNEPEPEMVAQIPLIEQWCEIISAHVFKAPGYEADDIIQTVVQQYLLNQPLEIEKKQAEIESKFDAQKMLVEANNLVMSNKQTPTAEALVFSADRDLFQMFTIPGVSFLQGKFDKGEYTNFSLNEFVQKYGVEPQQWVDYKALVGDPSDNLPGVPGVGPKTAAIILQSAGSLFYAYQSLKMDTSEFQPYMIHGVTSQSVEDYFTQKPSIATKLIENYDNVRSTYRLSRLKQVPNIKIEEKKLNLTASTMMILEYGFNSLVNDIKRIDSKNSLPEALL